MLTPNAELLIPIVLPQSARKPNAELLHPVVLHRSVSRPTAELLSPVVLERSEFTPNAELQLPVVLDKSALQPTATLFAPVVLLLNAPVPILVFVATLPPPSPISTPFTTMSWAELNDPVTLTEPVNCCVLDKLLPNTLEPLEYIMEEVIC